MIAAHLNIEPTLGYEGFQDAFDDPVLSTICITVSEASSEKNPHESGKKHLKTSPQTSERISDGKKLVKDAPDLLDYDPEIGIQCP